MEDFRTVEFEISEIQMEIIEAIRKGEEQATTIKRLDLNEETFGCYVKALADKFNVEGIKLKGLNA